MLFRTKILIVEDEDVLADNLKNFLVRSFMDVRIATDARSTMTLMGAFIPDVVVLDFDLPGMDGLQTYAEIVHRKAPQASCVMITDRLTESITSTANSYGIHHLLCMPFSFAELQQMIELSLFDGATVKGQRNLDFKVTTGPLGQSLDSLPGLNAGNLINSIGGGSRRREERRTFSDRRQSERIQL